MTKVIDLTLPLYDYMPVGNVWAWDVPFQTQPITNDKFHGYELLMITMHSETGTRLMIRAMQDPNAPKIDQIPLDRLVNRDAVVVDAPCGYGGMLTPEDIKRAFEGADFREGDAVIIRTGWGDDERWVKLGDDYARRTPFVSKEAAEKLVEIMKAKNSDLVGCDVAYWGRGDKYQMPEWASKPAWERNPFPSIEAKRYLASYTKEKAYADFQSPYVLNSADVMYIGAMCNLGAITKRRVKLTVLPMKIQGARGASCRVVAIED
jgi:kynurenine formamidase